MRADDLDFDLPSELVAQSPPPQRAASRLLHYRRENRSIAHRRFADLPSLLRAGDLLVMNDTRVLPARLALQKATGGRFEGLFVRERSPGLWDVLLKNVGTIGRASRYELMTEGAAPLPVTILENSGGGRFVIRIATDRPAAAVLATYGRMPLPPYIRRDKSADPRDADDRTRYQTVYAAGEEQGRSVAAPTAGLHFDADLLQRLKTQGIETTAVTLDVGLGTFKPVEVEDLADHVMHVERYTIPPVAAVAINAAKRDRRRVIAVGTTSARVLESQPAGDAIEARSGETNIFLYPPYAWRHVDALLTNFHLPRSTLIALVAAFIGLDEQRRIYAEAIAERYRFFSYGDASFLE